jgi:small-conductance mechanosensitive channel
VACAAVVLVAVLLLPSIPALAQDERATVRVDGRALFRVGAAADLTAPERARRVEGRIQTLLQNPQAAARALVEASATSGAERVVTVSGVPVVTVTESDAQDNLATVDALAAQWSQAIDAALERGRARRTSAWGRFAGEVQASVETAFSRLTESAITIIPRALAALLVLGLFWAVAAGVRWLMRLVFRRVVEDLTVENLIKQVAYYAVWALGLIVAADALGFEPQTVVTGLGLTGLALGFALKDIISNFVSGILILALRPFELGDQIVVGGTEGGVERIELRATQIRTYDGRVVLVPNADLFTSRIINNTAHPVRRGSVELYLGYDQDLRRAVEVALEAAQKAEGVLEEPPASVRVRELGQDDITVEARFWTDSRRSDFLATTSNVRGAIVDALKDAGIGLPDPGVRALAPRRPDKWREALGVEGVGAGERTGG